VTPFEIFFQRDTSAESSGTQESSSEEGSSDAGSSEETTSETSAETAASEATSEETYEDDISSIADYFQSNLYSEWSNNFSSIRSFIEYEVLDGSGATLD